MSKEEKSYDAESIKVLEGLEGVLPPKHVHRLNRKRWATSFSL